MSSAQGTKAGTMLKFVIDNANLTTKTADEADRLIPQIEAQGLTTTKMSVMQAISVARRLKGLQPPSRRSVKRGAYRKQPKAKITQNPRVEALESFVDDALKGLQMLKGELRRLKAIEKKYLSIKAQLT
jgi:hypothetical protein